VLIKSPVPTEEKDPVEQALASSQRVSSSKSFKTDGAAPNLDKSSPSSSMDASGGKTVADQTALADAMTVPVRAVRGAFEVRPQPPRSARVEGGQGRPAAFDQQQQQPTGQWEVWWVPLPRLDSDGMVDVPVDSANAPDLLADSARPFLIASNLRFIRWTVFQERERKVELSSTWSSDLPAYVEVEAETAAGLSVNWMFEIDWAVGPEVAHKPTIPGTPPAQDAANTAAGTPATKDTGAGTSGGGGFKDFK
jgi:hypothetical protein